MAEPRPPIRIVVTGPIDLTRVGKPLSYDGVLDATRGAWSTAPIVQLGGKAWIRTGPPQRLDWIIAGGESGPGARPMHPDWARALRDQCQAAGVSDGHRDDEPDLYRVGKKAAGRLLDGSEHNEFPA